MRAVISGIPAIPSLINAALSGLVNLNLAMMANARDRGLTVPKLYTSGVRYEREAPGIEDWRSWPEVYESKRGDCEDLVSWRVAELKDTGADPAARTFVFDSGPSVLHTAVRRGNGQIEDPSVILGMQTPAVYAKLWQHLTPLTRNAIRANAGQRYSDSELGAVSRPKKGTAKQQKAEAEADRLRRLDRNGRLMATSGHGLIRYGAGGRHTVLKQPDPAEGMGWSWTTTGWRQVPLTALPITSRKAKPGTEAYYRRQGWLSKPSFDLAKNYRINAGKFLKPWLDGWDAPDLVRFGKGADYKGGKGWPLTTWAAAKIHGVDSSKAKKSITAMAELQRLGYLKAGGTLKQYSASQAAKKAKEAEARVKAGYPATLPGGTVIAPVAMVVGSEIEVRKVPGGYTATVWVPPHTLRAAGAQPILSDGTPVAIASTAPGATQEEAVANAEGANKGKVQEIKKNTKTIKKGAKAVKKGAEQTAQAYSDASEAYEDGGAEGLAEWALSGISAL